MIKTILLFTTIISLSFAKEVSQIVVATHPFSTMPDGRRVPDKEVMNEVTSTSQKRLETFGVDNATVSKGEVVSFPRLDSAKSEFFLPNKPHLLLEDTMKQKNLYQLLSKMVPHKTILPPQQIIPKSIALVPEEYLIDVNEILSTKSTKKQLKKASYSTTFAWGEAMQYKGITYYPLFNLIPKETDDRVSMQYTALNKTIVTHSITIPSIPKDSLESITKKITTELSFHINMNKSATKLISLIDSLLEGSSLSSLLMIAGSEIWVTKENRKKVEAILTLPKVGQILKYQKVVWGKFEEKERVPLFFLKKKSIKLASEIVSAVKYKDSEITISVTKQGARYLRRLQKEEISTVINNEVWISPRVNEIVGQKISLNLGQEEAFTKELVQILHAPKYPLPIFLWEPSKKH